MPTKIVDLSARSEIIKDEPFHVHFWECTPREFLKYLGNPRPFLESMGIKIPANCRIETTIENNDWLGSEWDRNIEVFRKQSQDMSAGWHQGMPNPSKPLQHGMTGGPAPISLIAWPESPSPFTEGDPRFRAAMHQLATESRCEHWPCVGQCRALPTVGTSSAEKCSRGAWSGPSLVRPGERDPHPSFR